MTRTDRLEHVIEALIPPQRNTNQTLDRMTDTVATVGAHVQENSDAIRTLTDGLVSRLDALIEALLRRRDGEESR
jgi:hypothetical protein